MTSRPILIVEDEPGMRALLAAAILHGGERPIVEVGTGEGALAVAEQVRPEIVLLDLVLPGVDGYEVARRLKADPLTRDCWIVAVSSPGSPERAAHAGCDAYLKKPFRVDEVSEMIRSGLAQLHARSTASELGSTSDDAPAAQPGDPSTGR